jgi:hypothetical protein
VEGDAAVAGDATVVGDNEPSLDDTAAEPEILPPVDPAVDPEAEALKATERRRALRQRFWSTASGFWGGDRLAWPLTIGLFVLVLLTVLAQYGEASTEPDALQEILTAQEMETQSLQEGIENPEPDALQDSFFLQPTVLVGLIAQISGLALQEDIASMVRRLQQLGRDILDRSPHATGGSPDAQTPNLLGQAAPSAAAIQLGGSALGP